MARCCEDPEHWDAGELRDHLLMVVQHCELCGVPFRESVRVYNWPELAHIFGGPNRHHIPENVLMLCFRCHDHQHRGGWFAENNVKLPDIRLWTLLVAKRLAGNLDADKLAKLAGVMPQYVLSLANRNLPEWFRKSREIWGHHANPRFGSGD